MEFNHKKTALNEAIGLTKKEMDVFARDSFKIVKMIDEKKYKRSVVLEKITKILNKHSKKEMIIIMFIALDMSNEGKYYLMGDIIGSMVTSAMMEARRHGIEIPLKSPTEEYGEIDDEDDEEIQEIMDEMDKRIEKEKKKDKRFDYIG